MTRVHHLNAGWLHKPPGPRACCHCLLLDDPAGLALVDAGIGLEDGRRPTERVGPAAIDTAGFLFDPADTAVRQLHARRFDPGAVRHIILTHADPDHAGGLADFPRAVVHLSAEERANLGTGNPRYTPQFDHGPNWRTYGPHPARDWFGLPARPVEVGFTAEVLLVPLFGHTLGHCGVAVRQGGRWLLHVGDAYYLRAELETDDHPVSQLARLRADDDGLRRQSLAHLWRLWRDHPAEIDLLGYHDTSELPG